MLYNTDVNEHGTGEIGLAINSGRTNDFSGIDYDFGYNATALFPALWFSNRLCSGTELLESNLDGFHSEYKNIQRAAGFSNLVGGRQI